MISENILYNCKCMNFHVLWTSKLIYAVIEICKNIIRWKNIVFKLKTIL